MAEPLQVCELFTLLASPEISVQSRLRFRPYCYNQTDIIHENTSLLPFPARVYTRHAFDAAPLLPEDYSDEDVSTDRQMYRKTNIMKENMFQHGIDNPTLEKEPPGQIRSESKAQRTTRLSHRTYMLYEIFVCAVCVVVRLVRVRTTVIRGKMADSLSLFNVIS